MPVINYRYAHRRGRAVQFADTSKPNAGIYINPNRKGPLAVFWCCSVAEASQELCRSYSLP